MLHGGKPGDGGSTSAEGDAVGVCAVAMGNAVLRMAAVATAMPTARPLVAPVFLLVIVIVNVIANVTTSNKT